MCSHKETGLDSKSLDLGVYIGQVLETYPYNRTRAFVIHGKADRNFSLSICCWWHPYSAPYILVTCSAPDWIAAIVSLLAFLLSLPSFLPLISQVSPNFCAMRKHNVNGSLMFSSPHVFSDASSLSPFLSSCSMPCGSSSFALCPCPAPHSPFHLKERCYVGRPQSQLHGASVHCPISHHISWLLRNCV